MTGASLGPRTASYGSLQQQSQKGVLHIRATPIFVRKNTKLLTSSREKEKCRHFICCHFGLRKVAVLLLVALAILVFVFGTYTGSRESSNMIIIQSIEDVTPPGIRMPNSSGTIMRMGDTRSENQFEHYPHHRHLPLNTASHMVHGNMPPSVHICANFAFPPPPVNPKRFGPRPCPVCYLPVEQAVASMPSSPSASPVIHNLTYVLDENPIKTEPYGGSEFGGYPSLKQRNNSFDVKESMTVHCGFVKGSKPGYQTGFDIDEADLMELGQFHEVIVASAIFGNYDIIQQPKNVSELAKETVPFFMFIDEETEAYLKNSSILDSSKRVGLWRIILVRNIPYMDPRRNGKIPKLLLHRIFPSVRYSIWIDGKLQLVVDPYQILERFLWRQNATFAISRHYTRYDVFEEAEANKAAGKYSNASIDSQIEFYRKEGLKPYSKTKLPITSDVPEGCVIMREHIPITNLFTCLWFNEVDRFTSRDQLSFSTVRDKIIEKAAWSINMFLDCERRNFVIQAYHRELLEHMPPPAPPRIHFQRGSGSNLNVKTSSGKKSSTRRGRERKSGSKRNRKINAGRSRDNSF